MATSFSTNVGLGKPAVSDTGWGVTLNTTLDLVDALSPLAALCVQAKEHPSTTLNVKVAAGTFRKADGTIVAFAGTASFGLTASGTRYLWLTDAGVLTAGSAFPVAGTNHVRLAVVVVGGTTITSVTDARLCFISANTP